MYFAIIDCGTTNSRVYVLNDKFKIIKRGTEKIGVRDTAISGSKDVLKLGLKNLLEDTILSASLKIKDIKFVITFGMITSEIGLIEIPHRWVPVGVNDLASNIKVVQDRNIFPLDIPIIFIPGVKNTFKENSTHKDIRKIDFMRGEETQAAGLLSSYPDLNFPIIMAVLSSHTKYLYINSQKQIASSLTNLSGQVYEAIKKETSIGKSLISDDNLPPVDYFDLQVIESAYSSVKNAGFLRTLLMPRFMEVLLKNTWYERDLFLDAAISAEDLKVLNEFSLFKFSLFETNFVLVGHYRRCRLLKHFLIKHYHIKKEIRIIFKKEEIDQLGINGAINIAQKAGYLKKNRK
ncbi:MAG: 2-dehydro-3-deoxygalactonokinase [Candidatus Caldatribacteriota bacterium]|nr:2-dehydro-3-deoxygalactonokinase [Candidatus Caldatribacteriota bacterium]